MLPPGATNLTMTNFGGNIQVDFPVGVNNTNITAFNMNSLSKDIVVLVGGFGGYQSSNSSSFVAAGVNGTVTTYNTFYTPTVYNGPKGFEFFNFTNLTIAGQGALFPPAPGPVLPIYLFIPLTLLCRHSFQTWALP